jgi:DNA-directed RNA polymerase subunit N (RpoN/RPB10)
MTGPCLCGDVYCSSCGDPGAAAHEAWIERLYDITSDFDDIEAKIFEEVGIKAVKAYREAQETVRDRMTDPNW